MNKKYDFKHRIFYDKIKHKKARIRKKKFKNYYDGFLSNVLGAGITLIPFIIGCYILKKLRKKLKQSLLNNNTKNENT